MRKAVITVLLAAMAYLHSSGQDERIRLEFVEANPLWYHMTFDINNHGVGRYNNFDPYLAIRKHDDVILVTHAKAPNGDVYGFILERLNIVTGVPHWATYNTYHNNDSTQDYLKDIYFRDDGSIEVLASQRLEPISDNLTLGDSWYFNQRSRVNRRIYDFESGSLSALHVGQDTFELYGPWLSQIKTDNEDTYLLYHQLGFISPDSLNMFSYVFYKLNEDHDLVESNPFDTVVYVPDNELEIYSIELLPKLLQIDDNTLVAIFLQDRYRPQYYTVQVMYIDVSDVSDIRVKRQINLINEVPYSLRSLISFRYYALNEQIFYTHEYPNDELQTYLAYIIWMNAEGEIVSNVRECRYGDHFYTAVRVMYADPERAFVWAHPSHTGRNGLDILRISAGSNSLEYINSLTTNSTNEGLINIRVYNLYEDGRLIVGAQANRILEDETVLRRIQYYCFDASELGIDFSVAIENENKAFEELLIYPNPVVNKMVVEIPDRIYDPAVLVMYNSFGQNVITRELRYCKTCVIETSDLSPGVYFLEIADYERKNVYLAKLIKL